MAPDLLQRANPRALQAGGTARGVDLRFVVASALTYSVIGASVAIAVAVAIPQLSGHTAAHWGYDFRAGLWPAARAVLRGASPYVAAKPQLLRSLVSSYVWPPLLAELVVPLAHMPFSLAIGLWGIANVAGFAGALWLLGVRDWRMYALAMSAYPFLDTLHTGQPEGLFVLLLALAWRGRDSWRGGAAVAVLIAAKLVAWPLILWLVFTRRWRQSAIAATGAMGLLAVSWAVIDFRGLLQYPELLAADARAFESWSFSMSVVGLAMHLGASSAQATAIAMLVGFAAGVATVIRARGSDQGWFSAMVLTGLLICPLMWTHYLVLLVVPLAVGRRRSLGPWFALMAFWVFLPSSSYMVRAVVTIAGTVAVAMWSTARRRPDNENRTSDAAAAGSWRVPGCPQTTHP